jgi:hypothetical protein
MRESADQGDWLKVPSDVAISLGHPEWGPLDVKAYLEREKLTDTLLYRRLEEDPYFEEKIKARQEERERARRRG